MKSAKIAHSMQNNYAYSNAVQQQMVFEQKSKKAKYWFDFFNPFFNKLVFLIGINSIEWRLSIRYELIIKNGEDIILVSF